MPAHVQREDPYRRISPPPANNPLKVGDQVTVSLHEGGSIVLTPVRPLIGPEKAAATAKRLIEKNAELFRRLS